MLDVHPWGEYPLVDRVLAPYVGLRPDLLFSRQIMTLQCYIDDSGSEPQSKYYVLAGYISKVGSWAKFSSEWGARLSSSGLDYFKMSEAMGWRGQFSKESGWDENSIRNEVECLSKIISDNCSSSISCRVKHTVFDKHVKSIPMGIPRNNTNQTPYYMLYMLLISNYWMLCERLGTKDRCEFIFDRQHGFEQRAKELYPVIIDGNKRMFPKSNRSYVGSTPSFEDDKEYLPIQAADMMAWSLRRFKGYGNVGRLSDVAMENLLSVEHQAYSFPCSHLSKVQRMLNRDIEKIREKNPLSRWY